MITTAKAQEIMAATNNPHIVVLCETIIDLWRMFAEANCDAVMTRDELDELMARISKIQGYAKIKDTQIAAE